MATASAAIDVALALDEAEGFAVEVLNPKKASDFARSLGRSKTDKTDALALAEYSRRMKFVAWKRPCREQLELRALGRHITTLTEEHARLSNRLHAAQASRTAPRCVREDLKRTMAGIQRRLVRLRREARTRIEKQAEMRRKWLRLRAMPGVGEISAVQILAELAGLDEDMTVRQWVAHSGLDPAHETSGTSVRKPSHISRQGNRYLRRALFMPALTAARFDPYLKAFYGHLSKTQNQAPGTHRCGKKDPPRHLRHLQNRYALRWRQTLPRHGSIHSSSTSCPSYLLGMFLLLFLLFNRESSLRSG